MPLITHKKDPSGIGRDVTYNPESGINLINWLFETFENDSELCGDLACDFYLNGKKIFSHDKNETNDESLLDITLGTHDHVVIVNRPAGLDPISWAVIIVSAVSAAVGIYTYLNMPKLPGAAENAKESPNNLLNAASNAFRPNEAIPQCFGYGVSYPDFIQPSYFYYENNIKRQVGLFCITEGEVNVPEVRVGETDILEIPGSSATLYKPGQNVPSEFLTIHQGTDNVSEQILIGPNDSSVSKYDISKNVQITASGSFILDCADVIEDLSLADGDLVRVFASYFDGGVVVLLDGDYEILEVGNDYIKIDNSGTPITESCSVTINRLNEEGVIDNYIGWFTLPGDEATEVWFHWRMPAGIRRSNGNAATIQIEFEIEKLDENDNPTGEVWTRFITKSGNTPDAQYETTRFNEKTAPGITAGKWRARARRVNDIYPIGSLDRVQLESFVSVTPYSNPNFGDTSRLLVQRKAEINGPDQAGQKINLDYRRLLPVYDRINDVYQTNVLAETDSFADAVAYTLIERGNETENTVDLEELYGIYDGLSSPRLGSFTFTFDDADVSGGERVESMCNVARVVSFHDGYTWRFNRDELKPVSGAMFNRRNVTGNNAKQAWQPQRSDDSDSVRIIYVDDDTNTEAYIERKFDLNTGEIISGDVGAIVNEIKLAGCRDEFQAINRAELEIRRIAYQRRGVTDTTSRAALTIDLLDRVSWVDINDLDTFDGEILGINGDTYDTSERFEPEDGKSYVVFITDEDGNPSNTVTCLPRTDTEFGFIAVGLSGAYLADGFNSQLGSQYFIADADDTAASLYTLKSRTPTEGNTVEIELTEYDPRMYEKDDITPPEGQPILPDGLTSQNVGQSVNVTADLVFANDGSFTASGVNNLWFSQGVTPNIGNDFEIMATLVSGTAPTGTLGSWIAIDGATWGLTTTATDETESCVLSISIRQISTPENAVTKQIAIEAINAIPVTMPALLSVEGVITAGNGFAQISFNSDASISTSDAQFASYTTSGTNIGRLYECLATNVVGDVALDNADVWIQLNAGGAQFRIDSATAAVTDFDVEVREIADPLNTDTMSVSLNVVAP